MGSEDRQILGSGGGLPILSSHAINIYRLTLFYMYMLKPQDSFGKKDKTLS